MMRLGIDLGGSKIEAAVYDGRREIYSCRVATPQGNYPQTLKTIVTLIEQAERAVDGPCSVGIGTPGSVSAVTGKMRNCNSTCLNGQALQQDLQQLLSRDIRMANDANCFALSEAEDGAGAGHSVVFGVILGTGVGGGVVVNGHLITGANAIAGEWGHNKMLTHNMDGGLTKRPCYCGRLDCIETYLSGPGFVETYRRLSGRDMPPQEIICKAKAGDELAAKAYHCYQKQLATALSQVINVLDPDVIVLGGGMSKIQSLYTDVTALWADAVFTDTIATLLKPPVYGDASGVRGAAWLWPLNGKTI
jgi:fructokinase